MTCIKRKLFSETFTGIFEKSNRKITDIIGRIINR
jgi:uncharacterized lipoprotein YajG